MLPKKLRTYRQIWAVFFFALFLLLLFLTDFGRLKGYQTSLLLELDPLTALAAFLTSGTFYKGFCCACSSWCRRSSSAASFAPGSVPWGS